MRRLALVWLVALGSGCLPRTELVVGLAGDLKVPEALDLVTMDSGRDPLVPIFQAAWPSTKNGALLLPGSVGLYSPDGTSVPVGIVVKAFQGGKLLLTRAANVTLLDGQTLFLRLSLTQACIHKACGGDTTCVEGACVSQEIDSKRLLAYRAETANTIACASGATYVDGATGAPLPVGAGCAAGEVCQEGACLKAP